MTQLAQRPTFVPLAASSVGATSSDLERIAFHTDSQEEYERVVRQLMRLQRRTTWRKRFRRTS